MNIIQSNVKTMNSEELADLLQLRHDNVRQSAKNLQSHGVITFTENVVKGNGRPKLVLQFDERNSIIIAAKLNDKLLAAVVDRWRELEAAAQAPAVALPDFSDPVAAARAWADAKESEQAALLQIEQAKPAVAFVENLVERKNLMNAGQVGQKHGLSAVKLNRMLDELKVYNKSIKRARTFNQWFIDKGYGELKQTEQGYSQALFTSAGEVWINEQLISEGVV